MRDKGSGSGDQKAGNGLATPAPKSPDLTPKWAGGGLPPLPDEPVAKPEPKPAPRSPIPDSSPAPSDRQAILDDPKLNDILGSLPGATITEIK